MLKLTLAVLVALSAVSTAIADTKTTNFNVLLTITSACNFTTAASDVNFASNLSTATNIDTAGTLRVTCTKGTPFTIGLGVGNGTGATTAARKMKATTAGNTEEVPYVLYRDSGRTLNWGDAASPDTLGSAGLGTEQAITVYGRVPSANFPADSYKDIIVATVTY